MKRWAAVVVAWMWAFAAWAADVEHKRGDFSFFVGPAPAFVVQRQIPAQWDPEAPGAADTVWRFWLVDEQVDRRRGADHDYLDYAYEVKSTPNLGDAGRFQIEFNPGYQRLVLHRVELRRDGAWHDRMLPEKISLARRESDFEKDLADGQVTALIVLDDVRVDDVVRIAYTITGSNPILVGQTMDTTRLGWRSPILDAHMRVLYDPGTRVRTHQENGLPAPAVRTRADAVEVVADAHGAAAVVDEENYPAWYQPFPSIQVGPARSWADVVAWALPLYPKAAGLPADLETRIAEWARLPDPRARLRAALRAVQDEVRYFGVEMGNNTHKPNDPADTWRRRWGDCKDKAYLLATVLARLDVQAVPALVSIDRGRALEGFIPTAGAFDHVIVRATIDGVPVWVDPTMTQQGGDPRDTDLSTYGVGLPIAPGISALEAIPAPQAVRNAIRTVERYAPEGTGGGVRLEIATTYEGSAADNARRTIAGSRSDEMQRRYADYYRKRHGELDVATPPAVEDDRGRNTLKVTEAYLLKSPFDGEGGSAHALDVYAEVLDGASRLPPSMVRTGPLDIGAPAQYRHEVQVKVPEGWRSTASREQNHFASPAFDYDRRLDIDGDVVKVVYDMRVKQRELPAGSANAHLGELRKLRDNLGARLRFQAPPARIETRERDERLKALLRDVMAEGGTQ